VGCFWCDVKESWDENLHPQKKIDEILTEAKKETSHWSSVIGHQSSQKPRPTGSSGRGETCMPAGMARNEKSICVITGGEPLMHNLTELTSSLQQNGFQTHLETSGAYPVSGKWNWICLSPKKFKAPLPEVFKKANELKVVIYKKSDFKWAEQNASHVSSQCQLYLQPEWTKSETITPLIIDYIKANPQWQLSLQIHKYINVP
jgi:7-carboxy-7-deazaguanine synthase